MFRIRSGVIMKLFSIAASPKGFTLILRDVLTRALNLGELLSISLSRSSLLNNLAGEVFPKSSAKVYLKF